MLSVEWVELDSIINVIVEVMVITNIVIIIFIMVSLVSGLIDLDGF